MWSKCEKNTNRVWSLLLICWVTGGIWPAEKLSYQNIVGGGGLNGFVCFFKYCWFGCIKTHMSYLTYYKWTDSIGQLSHQMQCKVVLEITIPVGARICQQLDVFHQRNLPKILGITWKDHVTNMEVLSRTEQRRWQDIVAERRLQMAGHIIGMPPGRPANHAMSWTPRGSGRRRGRPTKTWRSTFKEDLVDPEVDCDSVRTVTTNKSRWRTRAAHCLVKDRRI